MVTAIFGACGISVRRDLSAIPAGQVGFDDMCGLQGYFDAIASKKTPAPALVSSTDLEGAAGGSKTIRGGRGRYAFESEFQLQNLRRVLGENWRSLPPELGAASRVELEVTWSERAGVRRVVEDRAAELAIGGQRWDLPYQVCLSELVYGEPLYKQRGMMWGTRPALPSLVSITPAADAGAGDALRINPPAYPAIEARGAAAPARAGSAPDAGSARADARSDGPAL